MEPEFGKDFILYLVEEIGEVIAIVKKKGSSSIAEDPVEISEAFLKKHSFDMARNYEKEYKEQYNGKG